MASKVNTKFVLARIVVLIAATGIIGGLFVLRAKGTVQRNMKAGDEAFAAGDYEVAYSLYGRASRKDPGNFAYLQKVEDSLLKLRPEKFERASELYRMRLEILHQRAEFDPSNPQLHLAFLNELYSGARMIPSDLSMWQWMEEAAKNMWNGLPEDEPARAEAKIFQSMATFHLGSQRTFEQIEAAEQELQEVVKAQPKNDLAWATLVMGEMAMIDKLIVDGMSATLVQQQIKKTDQVLQDALQAVPNGPETTKAHLQRLLLNPGGQKSNLVSEQNKQVAQKLAGLIHPDLDPGLIGESVDLLSYMPPQGDFDGVQLSIDLLNRHVEAHSEANDQRVRLARRHYFKGELDEAEKLSRQVLAAQPSTAGFLSKIQFDLKRLAGGLLVDIQCQRWYAAAAADKPKWVKAMEDARADLATVVPNPDSDFQILRADGKIAYAKGEIQTALAYFDRLMRETTPDIEVLAFSADCLERTNQIGAAYQRICAALALSPDHAAWLSTKARLEYGMGRFDDAATTLETVPESERKTEFAIQLDQAIQSRRDTDVGPAEQNPVMDALQKAQDQMNKGEVETARATLLSAYQKSPDDPMLLYGLTQLEMQAGQPAKAREYLDSALALRPGDRTFLRLDSILKNSDPIAAMREFHSTTLAKESDRNIAMLLNLSAMARDQQAVAEREEKAGNVEGAAKARELAGRAQTEATALEQQVQENAPNSPHLLEYQFQTALYEKNWDRAEQLSVKAKTLNADQVDGLLYRGRYELARGQFEEAVRILEDATKRMSYSAPVWRALAYAYQGLSNDTQALRSYEEAYACNPNDIQSAREFLNLLLRNNQSARALRILQPLHRLAPQDNRLRDMWLDLEASIGDKPMALRARRDIYRNNPQDRENARRLAIMLGRLEASRDMILDEAGNPQYTDQRWATMSIEERDQIATRTKAGWSQESDQIFARIIADGGDDLVLASQRAALLRERGQVNEGERVLKDYFERHPDSPQKAAMLIEVARYQIQSNHFVEAIRNLEEATAYQDSTRREADRELSILYMQLSAYEQALKHLKLIMDAHADPVIQSQMVECLVKLEQFDEAEIALKGVRGGEPYVATMLTASIAGARADQLWSKGDQQEAQKLYVQQRELFARAETEKPNVPTPRIFLAESLLKEFRRTSNADVLDDALEALRRAEEIRPDSPDIGTVRITVLREKGDLTGLIAEAKRLLEINPDSVPARHELVQAYVQARDEDSAFAVVDEAIKYNPTLAMWHEAKGNLYRFSPRRDAREAFKCYVNADELAPSATMLIKVVDSEFMIIPPDCQDICNRLEARPDHVAATPVLREYHSRALNCVGKRDEALQQARIAYNERQAAIEKGAAKPVDMTPWFQLLAILFDSGQPGVIDASAAEQFFVDVSGGKPLDMFQARLLAKTWFMADDPKRARAVQLQRQAIALCPATETKILAQLNTELADMLLVARSLQEAAAAYQAVLAIDADNIAALNNLSFLMAEDLKQPAEALPYAERAAKLAPKEPTVLDTLGWVHHLAGNSDSAQQYLQEALMLDKRNVAFHIHMAQILIKANDLAGAERYLNDAQKLPRNDSYRHQIESLLDDVRKARTSGR